MSSRLDRLLVLLESGSSPSIRETAARQIAQFAAKNVTKDAGGDVPLQDGASASTSTAIWHGSSSEWNDVMTVVGKILPYLHSKSFETRTAATSALAHICQMTPAWSPTNAPPPIKSEDPSSSSPDPTPAPDFPPFDVRQLIKEGTLLLASSGKEFSEPVAFGTPAEVARARKEAMSRLGLGFMDGMDDDDDLDLTAELSHNAPVKAESPEPMDIDSPGYGPSAKAGSSKPYSPAATPGASSSSSPPPSTQSDTKPSTITLNPKFPHTIKTETGPSSQPPLDSPSIDESGLSARERIRLKRKLKMGSSIGPSSSMNSLSQPPAKVRVVGTDHGPKARPVASTSSAAGPSTSRPGLSSSISQAKIIVDPSQGGHVEAKEKSSQALALLVPEGTWVWSGVVSVLLVDLFSPNWEVRHGAAMALRELIKVRGAAGGMKNGSSADENFIAHEKWCNDLASKFLCIFVLDRFSDFVSDQMVAPVRETVSQTLAALLTHMPRRSVLHVHTALLSMVQLSSPPQGTQTQNGNGNGTKAVKVEVNGRSSGRGGRGKGKLAAAPEETKAVKASDSGELAWQVRHAGLVGMKYEVAVRPDLFDVVSEPDTKLDPDTNPGKSDKGLEVLQGVVDAAVSGLCSQDDDVRTVAATCLTPITAKIVERLPGEVARVLGVLWDCLSDMRDDLSSSVGFVMELLGKLLSYDLAIAVLTNTNSGRPLSSLVPILFPFFRHTIPNVRIAVVNTLNNFLSVPNLSDDWVNEPVLRLLFQNLIVEERKDIQTITLQTWRAALARLRSTSDRLLHTVSPFIRDWFALLMSPLGVPIATTLLFHHIPIGSEEGHNVDKSMITQDLSLVSVETILRARVAGAQALAIILSIWPADEQSEAFGVALEFYQQSSSMLQQFLAATIVHEWALEFNALAKPNPSPSLRATSSLADKMTGIFFNFLNAEPPSSYYEMHLNLASINASCRALLDAFQRDGKVPAASIPAISSTVDPNGTIEGAFTIAMANDVATRMFDELKAAMPKGKKKEIPGLEARRAEIIANIEGYAEVKTQHDARIAAAVAGALIALRELPSRLNPIIRSVMNGVKFEENADLQLRAARSVAAFASFSAAPGAPRSSAVDKIVRNLGTFLCSDPDYAPVFTDWNHILEGIPIAKQNQLASTGKGKNHAKAHDDTHVSPEVAKDRLIRRGAEMALAEIASEFGEKLFDTLPVLWEIMATPLIEAYDPKTTETSAGEITRAQTTIDCLTVIRSLAPTVHPSLHERITSLFPQIISALKSSYAIVRQCAAKCIATLCNVMTVSAMRVVVEEVIPLLGDAKVLTNKQGAIEVIYNIVKMLEAKALPYIIFLIVPVLGRMSDPDDDLRYIATNTFASLVKMVPLESGLPDPPGFSPDLLAKRETERGFLTQLLDGSQVENYKVPVPIQADLRKYQQDGVNWLAFLAKYQLHGILCDDMGLGKTLQSICILAGKHHERAEKWKTNKSPDSAPLPSLIVCPPTLVGHWYHEIKKYAHSLKPIMYVGNVKDRAKLVPRFKSHDVVVTSYDVVRNDQLSLAKQKWHYCILDEGHVIKNAKAKLTKAVKTIQAHHRLILSGTPIQNNVLELWSLFDFLMPGFLGTEAFFNERFGKPITSSRDSKSSAKVKEAASNALEALHKQVLPFLLRRLKEDVLGDLPPKIIQDYTCDLSELQKQLYDAYANSAAMASAQSEVQNSSSEGGLSQKHVFQSLQYLRKVCNHPALVLKPEDLAKLPKKEGEEIAKLNVRDIQHAPKLEALKQLLTDCGVGVDPSDVKEETLETEANISQHRVLIFCQMKQMLDIIETDLFRALMPSVTYMRLDGTVDATKRHAIVETFNADPSIDCLLLTTHVGGLGLTLTGADTVIFVEHDWNPMKDLQAMDRAHRLGQKKVVNVYRLITRGTLEEKIMGLQRFKLNVANSVITQQNSGLSSMDTDSVLDLFQRTTEEEDAASAAKKKAADKKPSTKNVLDGLDDLPPEEEYNFDLSSFLGTLGKEEKAS